MKTNLLLCATAGLILSGCGGGSSSPSPEADAGNAPTQNIISAEEAVRAAVPQQVFDELDAKLASLNVQTDNLTGTWLVYGISKGEHHLVSPTVSNSVHFRKTRSEIFHIVDNEVLNHNNENIRVQGCTNLHNNATFSNEYYNRGNGSIQISISSGGILSNNYDSSFAALLSRLDNSVEYEKQAFSANVIDNRRIDFFTNVHLTDTAGDIQGTLELTIRARKIRNAPNQGIGSIIITGSPSVTLGCATTSLNWTKTLNSSTFNGSTSIIENDSYTNLLYTNGSVFSGDIRTVVVSRIDFSVFTDNFYSNGTKQANGIYAAGSAGLATTVIDSANGTDLSFSNIQVIQDTISETFIDSDKPSIDWTMTATKRSDGSTVSIEVSLDPFM